jgi:hypothetical protein
MGIASCLLVWLIGTAIIMAVGIGRDKEPADRHKLVSLFVIAAGWPLLIIVFVLGVVLWMAGVAIHLFRNT